MGSIRLACVLSVAVACVAAVAAAPAEAASHVWKPTLLPGAQSLKAPSGTTAGSSRAYVAGQLIVEFKSGVTTSGARAAARDAGAIVSRQLPSLAAGEDRRLVLVSSATQSTRSLTSRFANDSTVTRTSPNYIRCVDTVPPDDPGLVRQWGVANVRAGDAWERTTGSSDVVIASIDTGVDLLQSDLAANIWSNPGEIPANGVDDDGNGYVDDVYGIDTAYNDCVPMDDYGHGTHTMGIAAAVGDNGVGVSGVGWQTKIMALKFINEWGGGTDAAAIECIDYVVKEKLDYGVNVVAINASWGGGSADLFLRNAIARAGDAGIVFCAAAGNDGTNNDYSPHYPSSFDCPNIISVAASTADDKLADFSNWGQVSVDLAAPGEDILSTLPDDEYECWSGTSMAAPFVTGTVALCAALYPDENVEERVDRVLATVRAKDRYTKKMVSGGTLDTAAAVGLGATEGDTQAPTTTALRVGTGASSVNVPVLLFASDGTDGSGVAATRWRVDGGAWHTGSRAVVVARRRTRRTRVLEYRSVDAAGNVEELHELEVPIDTTAAGRRASSLPDSPVTGGLSARSSSRTYTVRLQAGETLHVTSDVVTGGEVAMIAYRTRPSRRLVGVWYPPASQAFDIQATRDSRYSLVLVYWFFSAGSVSPYSFSYSIAPKGTDVVPPHVAVEGLTSRWSAKSVSGRIIADDGSSGSGVAKIEQSLDGGLTWEENAEIVVEAPADHSNDGHHSIRCRAVDVVGNVSEAVTREVRIDTEGPTTQTWGPLRNVRRGGKAVIRYRADDLAEYLCGCRLQVRSATTGRLVDVKRLRHVYTADTIWWDPDYRYRTVIRCNWPAGKYTVKLAGSTHDPAGNRCESAVCERLIVVK